MQTKEIRFPKVAILLSSYNGEKFIAEQVDSLLAQEGVDIHIIVRDDGSTDNTVDIIKEFKAAHPGKIELIEGANVGWCKSFFLLVEYAAQKTECEFYAFCDQDDIWLPDKLRVAVSALESMPDKTLPRLYCSNLFYYKDGINFGKIRKKKPIPTYKNCLVRNYATGCTIVFDNNLLKLIAAEPPGITVAHDYWAYMVAVLCGNVCIDNESYILYRQHENNQIGSKSGFYEIWKHRISDLREFFNSHQREEQSRELMRLFSNHMYPNSIEAVSKLCNYRRSFFNQISLLCDNEYTLGYRSNDFWFKVRVLLRQV